MLHCMQIESTITERVKTHKYTYEIINAFKRLEHDVCYTPLARAFFAHWAKRNFFPIICEPFWLYMDFNSNPGNLSKDMIQIYSYTILKVKEISVSIQIYKTKLNKAFQYLIITIYLTFPS